MQFFMINPVLTLVPNDSLEQQLESTESTAGKLEHTVRIMNAACIPVLVIAGIVLNATSCAVMRGSSRMTDQTYTPYFVWLAASDSAFLLSLLVVWSTSVGLTDLYARDGWCLTVTYVSATGAFLAPWYNVALAVDRAIRLARASPSPPTKPRLRGPGPSSGLRSHLVCLGLLLVAVPAFLNSSLIYGVVETGRGHLCVALPRYVAVAQVLAELEMIVGVLVPSALIVCFNVGTVLFLSRRCCCSRGGRLERSAVPPSFPGPPESTTSSAGREAVDLSVVVQQPLVEEISVSSPTFERPSQRPSNDLDIRATSSVVLVTTVHLLLSLPAQLLQSWVMLSSVSAERTFRVPQGVILVQHLLLVAWYLRFGCNFPLLLIFNPFVYCRFRLMLRKTFRLKRPRL